jgi:hypothetical protein
LDGYDPNGSNYTTDAVLLDVSGISPYVCDDSISPKITIRNHGSTNLTSLDIYYQLDGAGYTQVNWTGNLSPYTISEITVPTLNVPSGLHTFNTYCTNPNGTVDDNIANDSSATNFNSNAQPIFATLNITTDNFGAETSWLVRDFFGDIVLQGGGYPSVTGGDTISENLCLYDSCFTFVLQDSYGDGYCCAYGNGNFQLLNNWGDTIAEDYSFNGDSLTFPFCLGSSSGINEISENRFTIYPNPNKGIFNIDFQNSNWNNIDINVYDMVGRKIFEQKNDSGKNIQINIGNVKRGIYLISISSNKGNLTRKILVN